MNFADELPTLHGKRRTILERHKQLTGFFLGFYNPRFLAGGLI